MKYVKRRMLRRTASVFFFVGLTSGGGVWPAKVALLLVGLLLELGGIEYTLREALFDLDM